jgi:predicted HNH restriction endonuclease
LGETFYENIVINEGFKKTISVIFMKKSIKRRDTAIKEFTVNGVISCDCCEFNFEKFYGKEIGTGYIEIHHLKPIFKYQQQELKKFINEAMKNLIPVCSNCHRMIHRVWKNPLEIDALKKHINKNGIFQTKSREK